MDQRCLTLNMLRRPIVPGIPAIPPGCIKIPPTVGRRYYRPSSFYYFTNIFFSDFFFPIFFFRFFFFRFFFFRFFFSDFFLANIRTTWAKKKTVGRRYYHPSSFFFFH